MTLILDGNTQIKQGITSSTFNAVPDAPIKSFELKLPTGKFSVFGTDLPAKAKYNLCGQALTMPTVITGQNGVVVKQSTKVATSGCPKAKKSSRSKKTRHTRKASHGHHKGSPRRSGKDLQRSRVGLQLARLRLLILPSSGATLRP